MLKKSLSLILVYVLILAVGCTKAPQVEMSKTNIVCTTFAAFDWVRSITKGAADVEVSLLGGGQDLHSFQPGAKDIADIHNSKLTLCLGGQSDLWVKDVENNQGEVLAIFDVVGRENLIVPNHHHGDGHDHHDHEFDEHIWLSLKLAKESVVGICEKLCQGDPENEMLYRANTEEYCKALEDLDKRYQEAVESSKNRTVVFADRYPFAYMMRDYGIECYAAFDGCSADTDATFETVLELADAVKNNNKKTVAVLENSNEEIVRAINNALRGKELNYTPTDEVEQYFEIIDGIEGRTVLSAAMDSMQTMAKSDVENKSYVDIMEKNLDALKMALR